ncbi:hypothetical protein [Lentzea sp. NPDC004782]|uniref:hypothetical protein n=1 Tax=Lentzea sp. NPDC004782 TaxID=3154458 RepID=UPI0033ACB0A9
MAAEILTEELLRVSLVRLSREIEKTHPHFGEVLAQHIARVCGLDPDRVRHFQELGVLLMDLGRLYLAEADVLRNFTEEPEPSGLKGLDQGAEVDRA